MALETGTYISDLVATNPTSTDPKSEGDDHLRLLKSTLKTTFPNVTGAVSATHIELGYMAGVTGALQTQINAKAGLASPALTGTPTAPTATAGTNTTQLATTAFVASAAFSAALPVQTGNAGKFVTTDGATASWASAVTPAGAQTLTNKTLTSPVISSIVNTGTLTLPSSTDTLVGRATTDTLTNKTISAGTFTDGYTEETFSANTGTAYTIDLANGTVQTLTLTGNCTFTFPAVTAGRSFLLLLKQDATGNRTVIWPAAVKWPGATAPTITSTASKLDKYVFTADGTNWYGSNGGQNYTV